jgi:hypothetical protein
MYGETRNAHTTAAGKLFSLLLKALEIRAYKTIAVLHRYDAWSLTLREEHKFRKMFGSRTDKESEQFTIFVIHTVHLILSG